MTQSKKAPILVSVDFHVLYLALIFIVPMFIWRPSGLLFYFTPFVFAQGIIITKIANRQKRAIGWIGYFIANELLLVVLCVALYAIVHYCFR